MKTFNYHSYTVIHYLFTHQPPLNVCPQELKVVDKCIKFIIVCYKPFILCLCAAYKCQL